MENPPAPLRGIVHRLSESGGVLDPEAVAQDLRQEAKKFGIDLGRFAIYLPAALKPGAARLRALFWGVWHDRNPPPMPAPGLVSASMPTNWGPDFALAMGWVQAGPLMIRLDVVERITRELNYLIRKHPILLPPNLGSRMGLKPDQLVPVLHVLGFRIIPAGTLGAKYYGPPNPALLARRKQEPQARIPVPAAPPPVRQQVRQQAPVMSSAAPVVDSDNPFAALAALKMAARR
jgi:ATP-dependent RNA helicase SUPV3L1/SUV3